MTFYSARLKLTAWYLLIIMVISLSFSGFVYRQLTFEVRRSLRTHALRFLPLPSSILPVEIDIDQIYEEIRHRILLQLAGVNIGIFVISGLAGYFLAGRTLRPIEVMVEDQKRFVADASHELRTPLTTMKTEIEVALRDKGLAITDTKTVLKSNLEEVNRMQQLSNYLLSLSSYQDQKQLSIEQLSLHEIIATAVERLKYHAEEKTVTVEVTGKDIRIKGNVLSLTELITILLDNAIKYSYPQSQVSIKTTSHSNAARIEITDHGVGIPTSEIPYIFNRFYRADSSRQKTATNGYGLGLSIAKRIVELHNGNITADSTVDKRTTFRIELPKT